MIQKIKALFKIKGVVKEATKGVQTMDGIKPGILTTEFWGKNIVQILVIYNAFFHKTIDPQMALELVGAIEGLYHGLRAAIKIAKQLADAYTSKAVVSTTTVAVETKPA